MQDKLIKTNHGPIRYSLIKFATNLSVCLLAIGAVALSLTIAATFTNFGDQNELTPETNEAADIQIEESELLTF